MSSRRGVNGKAKFKRPYNEWYSHTYDAIAGAVNWDDLNEAFAIKIALVYSWMPTVIMHHNTRIQVSSIEEVRAALKKCNGILTKVRVRSLMETPNLDRHSKSIKATFDSLSTAIGNVAASKYLHFSRPHFFPMYDTKIATIESGDDYFRFMEWVRSKLLEQENMAAARCKYPDNPLRGLDLVLMENRGRARWKFPPKRRLTKRKLSRARSDGQKLSRR